jgi:hypothetical protein
VTRHARSHRHCRPWPQQPAGSHRLSQRDDGHALPLAGPAPGHRERHRRPRRQSRGRSRQGLVRPLNTQVAEINGRYKPVRTALERLADELRKRLGAYARALEIERVRQAEAARQAAEEAERLAREAEAREREVFDDAEHGVVVDLAEAATAADTAFAAFQKADRTAARAERDSHIRITGGTGKAMGLRDREILTVTDWQAAITELGLTDNIRDAILTAARAYRKAFHELPEGITASYERGL